MPFLFILVSFEQLQTKTYRLSGNFEHVSIYLEYILTVNKYILTVINRNPRLKS